MRTGCVVCRRASGSLLTTLKTQMLFLTKKILFIRIQVIGQRRDGANECFYEKKSSLIVENFCHADPASTISIFILTKVIVTSPPSSDASSGWEQLLVSSSRRDVAFCGWCMGHFISTWRKCTITQEDPLWQDLQELRDRKFTIIKLLLIPKQYIHFNIISTEAKSATKAKKLGPPRWAINKKNLTPDILLLFIR